MKAATVFVAAVVTLEAFVIVQGLLVAVGLQETESTVLSIAAIVGGLGIIGAGVRTVCGWGRRAAHVGDVVLGLDERVERIEARQVEAQDHFSRVNHRLAGLEERLQVGGAERRVTD